MKSNLGELLWYKCCHYKKKDLNKSSYDKS